LRSSVATSMTALSLMRCVLALICLLNMAALVASPLNSSAASVADCAPSLFPTLTLHRPSGPSQARWHAQDAGYSAHHTHLCQGQGCSLDRLESARHFFFHPKRSFCPNVPSLREPTPPTRLYSATLLALNSCTRDSWAATRRAMELGELFDRNTSFPSVDALIRPAVESCP
jgi:hypothetical protein